MSAPRSVILIEFNELCPRLMHSFIAKGLLPNFGRLRAESHVFSTDAEEPPPFLEPWIQWVTVHSGLQYREHGIFDLGDGHLLDRKCVWDVVSTAGFPVWICGSMNANYQYPLHGSFLPDPWSNKVAPLPPDLESYLALVRTHVTEHAREDMQLSPRQCLKFVAFMMRHGLGISSGFAIARQLLSEVGGRNRWKRAAVMDRLQFDLFKTEYRRLRPRFATFFSNSTAHFQHMYWRNFEPDLFRVKPTSKEQVEFGNAVLFGYRRMDSLIRRFLSLADNDTILIFATGLSQQPCTIYEESGGKVFYLPKAAEALLDLLHIDAPHTIARVMAEQFHVCFSHEDEAMVAEGRLRGLKVEDQAAMTVQRHGSNLLTGCRIFHQVNSDARLSIDGTDKMVPFFEVFVQAKGMKSGMHHPEGMLWIRLPEREHRVYPHRVPLTRIAPTILELLALEPPLHMTAPSLLRQDGPTLRTEPSVS
jgi:hypothetical protein